MIVAYLIYSNSLAEGQKGCRCYRCVNFKPLIKLPPCGMKDGRKCVACNVKNCRMREEEYVKR